MASEEGEPYMKWQETEIMRKLMEGELAPAEAVGQIVARGIAVARAIRTEITEEETVNAEGPVSLGQHAYCIACCILRYAMNTRHDQQQNLVEFVLILWKTSVTDPETGRSLSEDGDDLWTDLPCVIIAWRDYVYDYVPKQVTYYINVDGSQAYENFCAFLAQLSERRFSSFYQNTSWCRESMITVLEGCEEETVQPEKALRLACMWLIYAPKKLRANALRSYEEDKTDPLRIREDVYMVMVSAAEGSPIWKHEERRKKQLSDVAFYPEFWAKWKNVLRYHEGAFSNTDTANLISKALDRIEEAEKADP